MVEDGFTPAGGFDWEAAEDFTALSEGELRRLLARVSEEERRAAYRHEVLRGRVDLIRGELVDRGVASLSPDELARLLVRGEGGTPS